MSHQCELWPTRLILGEAQSSSEVVLPGSSAVESRSHHSNERMQIAFPHHTFTH